MKQQELSLNRFVKYILNNNQKIAKILLQILCFIPVVISLICFIYGLLKLNPSESEIVEAGYRYGYIYLNSTLTWHKALFTIYGFVVVVYAIFCVIVCRQQIFTKDNFKQQPYYFLLVALLAIAFVSTLLSDDLSLAIFGSERLNDGLLSYFVYGAVFVIASQISQETYRLQILKTFIYVIVYLNVLMFLQFIYPQVFVYCLATIRSPVFLNANHFAYLLCASNIGCAYLFIYEKSNKKYLYLFLMAFITYGIMLNDSTAGALASICGYIFIVLIDHLQNKHLRLQALIPPIVFSIMMFIGINGLLPYAQDFGNSMSIFFGDIDRITSLDDDLTGVGSNRLDLWADTLKMIVKRPIFGYGPDGFAGENAILNHDSPHNEYLQVAAYLGLPALVLYVGSFITLAIVHLKRIDAVSKTVVLAASMLVTYLASAFFGNPVFYTYPYMWMLFGLTINNPLYDLSQVEIQENKLKIRSKKIRKLLLIPLVIFVCFLGLYSYIEYNNEAGREKADIAAMKQTENVAIALYKQGLVEIGQEYYFDEANFQAISVKETKPLAYGLGTKMKSDKVDYEDYLYDSSLDYRDKVISFIIKQENDNLIVVLSWK